MTRSLTALALLAVLAVSACSASGGATPSPSTAPSSAPSAASGECPTAQPDPLAVLDHRLADGTISPDEYRQRRDILTGKNPGARD